MIYFLFFLSLSVAVIALLGCYYLHMRVTKYEQSTKDLDWSALSNITGDLATLKKTIQTLNSRLNGMHSPKVADEELLRYIANNRVNAQNTNNNKIIGG